MLTEPRATGRQQASIFITMFNLQRGGIDYVKENQFYTNLNKNYLIQSRT